jgi:hypothetical protein
MILQGRDIQPEPSEKVRSPENDFEYVSDSLFLDSSSQKTRHELIRGALFHKAGEHFACRMSLLKGFSKFRASFPKLGRTKQGVDIENICHHLFQGQYVKQKGFNVDNIFDRKGIHVGSIM